MSMRVLKVLSVVGLVAVLLTCSDALAQRGGGRGGQGRGGFGFRGGFGGGTNLVAFVQRDDVKQEINLTGSQLDKIEALAEDRQGRGPGGFGDFGNFQDMTQEERQQAIARMREQRQQQQREQREKVNAILNPDQQKRLKELEFQYALQQGRLDDALEVASVDVEENELEDAQREAMERIREQMAKIQLEANSAALAKVLDKAKIDELMGKAFTFEQERPRFGRGGEGPGFGGGFGRGRGGGGDRPERPRRPGGGDDSGSDTNPRRGR